MPESEEDEGKRLFAARKAIMEHFKQKRSEVKGGGFAKQGVLGVINSCEKDALDRAERGDFKNVAGVLADCDRRIEEESRHLRGKIGFEQNHSD